MPHMTMSRRLVCSCHSLSARSHPSTMSRTTSTRRPSARDGVPADVDALPQDPYALLVLLEVVEVVYLRLYLVRDLRRFLSERLGYFPRLERQPLSGLVS